jgi:hypothetical protein
MNLQVVLNTFATEVFRDQADADYITARACWRLRLREQFLWSALQALEKYLKAILLFNGRSALWPGTDQRGKEFGHDLPRLFQSVSAIEDLVIELPEWAGDFFATLERFGNNRYLSKSAYSLPEWLGKLDELTWSLRRYAQFMRIIAMLDGEARELLHAKLQAINNPKNRSHPTRYCPFHGFLEKVNDRPPKDPTRQALVWNNQFYGRKSRKQLTYISWLSSIVPPQCRDWFDSGEWRSEVEKYVRLRFHDW